MSQSDESNILQGAWVVIPAYNEAARLGAVLSELAAVGARNVVVVDDGSRDETGKVARERNVWVLRHLVNRGQGAALQTGIEFAVQKGAQTIVTFDADGQHHASDLSRLLEPLQRGECDVVLGSRFMGAAPGIPWARRLLLKVAVWGTRLTTRLWLTDTHNGFRAMTAEATGHLVLSEDGMAHASEFLTKLGSSKLRWQEAPVTIRYSEQTLDKGQRNSAAFQIAFRMLVGKVVG